MDYGTGDRELLTPKDVEQHTKLCAQLAEFPYQLVQMVRRFRKTFQSTSIQEDNPRRMQKAQPASTVAIEVSEQHNLSVLL